MLVADAMESGFASVLMILFITVAVVVAVDVGAVAVRTRKTGTSEIGMWERR